jgi:hypothetical protein
MSRSQREKNRQRKACEEAWPKFELNYIPGYGMYVGDAEPRKIKRIERYERSQSQTS